MLRCSGPYSICDAEFLGKAVADDPFERARPSWGLQALGQVLQFRLIARLADRLAEAVGPLLLPPALLLGAQPTAARGRSPDTGTSSAPAPPSPPPRQSPGTRIGGSPASTSVP